MPELPEVEKARRHLSSLATGKRISAVQTAEDNIVYSGVTDVEFAKALEGRIVTEVGRKGKNFYLVLDSGPNPIFHFGMTGWSQQKGHPAPRYQRSGRQGDPATDWPPKYCKCILTLEDPASPSDEPIEWAFADPRRLGRIKLVEGSPASVPPLSLLGADPLLEMPPVDVLGEALAKRHAPIKAVLLDQNGPLCGIGNWMADEILYQAALHPSHPASLLSPDELQKLHEQIVHVVTKATDVDADSHLFPSHWLFSSRWGKGKNKDDFTLPSGKATRIKFITVRGRTSAVIEDVQKLPKGMKASLNEIKGKSARGKRKAVKEEEEDTPDDGAKEEQEAKPAVTSPHFEKQKPNVAKVEEQESPPAKRRRSARQSTGA